MMEATNKNEYIHYVISGVLAIAAILLAQLEVREGFSVLKPVTTVAVIAIPLMYGVSINRKYFRRLIVALIFCLAGDVFLLEEEWFLFGLGAFFIGHVFFSLAFISYRGLYLKWKPLVALLVIGGGTYAFLFDGLNDLAIPVAVYVLCILFMVWQAIGLYDRYRNRRFRFVMIGAFLFLASDAILAINKFKMPFDLAEAVVLSTYWMAIGSLAISTTFDMRD